MSIPAERYDALLRGFMPSRVLITAVELGVFDVIERGTGTIEELAATVGANIRALAMVLDALAALGLLEKKDGRYLNTDVAKERLLTDAPKSDVAMIRHHIGLWRSWSQLTEVVRTGHPATIERQRTEESYKDFIRAMIVSARQLGADLAEAIDLSRAKRLLDLGGGPGTYALAFCRRYPKLQAVVLDLPIAIEVAQEEIAKAGLGDRVTTHSADFMIEAIPRGFDAVLISNIIHSYGVEENKSIFRKVRDSLKPGGRVIVKDMYIDDTRTSPEWTALFSINMLVNTDSGKTYTRTETIRMLKEAGFEEPDAIEISDRSTAVTARVRQD